MDSPLCRKYAAEEDETSAGGLCECEALHTCLGSFFLDTKDVGSVKSGVSLELQ